MKNYLKISAIFIIFVIALLSLNMNSNINIYKNTKITDNKKIEKIINKLELKEGFKNLEITNNKIVINYEIEYYDYKTLEKNASYLFYLIKDLSDITFIIDEEKFDFSYEYIHKIYDKITIKKIKNRYNNKYFEYLYLGNINGNIDIFDKSDLCLENYEKLYENEEYRYYITCSSVDDVVVVMDGKEKKLKDAVENIIDINELFKTRIKIEKREKNENNS